ncbi:MAG TPA: SMP-30/gluconolactonase/LRE family protein [Terriglobia bacterium]|nr:SMP-30/gluconolactonase/LRE family protein [Terriglobia bacterium]
MRLAFVFGVGLIGAAVAFAQAGAPQLLPGEREAVVTAIPGVIAAGAKWQLIWADFKTADGIVGTPDGGVVFAQEQSDTIKKLDSSGREYVYLTDTHGAGAVSVDAQGRMFAVQRTCTDPGKPFYQSCPELTMVSMLAPERKMLANSFPDGKSLGRVNDLVADGKGGAYFTVGGAYHVSASGVVSTVVPAQDFRSNGIMLSADGKTLYVTNDTVVVALDVRADGSTANRRDFGSLDGDNGGDGMAIDSAGRLYVTGNKGVHVLSPEGKHLGLIPTPRRPITLAFSGPGKKTLYVPMMGAVGPDGKAWATPEGVRNTAMTMYTISTLAEGFKGRPK